MTRSSPCGFGRDSPVIARHAHRRLAGMRPLFSRPTRSSTPTVDGIQIPFGGFDFAACAAFATAAAEEDAIGRNLDLVELQKSYGRRLAGNDWRREEEGKWGMLKRRMAE